MKLYYIPGVSSLFPHITLREAGLAFELIKVDEHTKLTEHGKDYREVNPLGFVPALELADGTILTEGVAIAQYVGRRAPRFEPSIIFSPPVKRSSMVLQMVRGRAGGKPCRVGASQASGNPLESA